MKMTFQYLSNKTMKMTFQYLSNKTMVTTKSNYLSNKTKVTVHHVLLLINDPCLIWVSLLSVVCS